MDDAIRARLAQEADFRSRVNEKLLKALIGLLAVKDEHLLDELCVVFEHARQREGEVGDGAPEVWRGVDRQIGGLLDLAQGEDLDVIEHEAWKH